MSLKWQKVYCKPKLERPITHHPRSGKTSPTTWRAIFGLLAAFCTRCAHWSLHSMLRICRDCSRRFVKAAYPYCLGSTAVTLTTWLNFFSNRSPNWDQHAQSCYKRLNWSETSQISCLLRYPAKMTLHWLVRSECQLIWNKFKSACPPATMKRSNCKEMWVCQPWPQLVHRVTELVTLRVNSSCVCRQTSMMAIRCPTEMRLSDQQTWASQRATSSHPKKCSKSNCTGAKLQLEPQTTPSLESPNRKRIINCLCCRRFRDVLKTNNDFNVMAMLSWILWAVQQTYKMFKRPWMATMAWKDPQIIISMCGVRATKYKMDNSNHRLISLTYTRGTNHISMVWIA